jgi:hypothetical protein
MVQLGGSCGESDLGDRECKEGGGPLPTIGFSWKMLDARREAIFEVPVPFLLPSVIAQEDGTLGRVPFVS